MTEEIKPVYTTDTKAVTASLNSSDNQPLTLINESVFNVMDKNGDGVVTVEEAKFFGFTAWNIEESLSKAEFASKLKTYNHNLTLDAEKKQNKSEQNWQNQPRTTFDSTPQQELKYDPEIGTYTITTDFSKEPTSIDKLPEIGDYNFSGTNLKGIDFRQYPKLLRMLAYDSNTFDKSCEFPATYDPIKVIELGKNPGQNVKAMHEMGLTGKGVRMAIFDWKLNPHEDYDGNIKCYEEMNNAGKSDRTYHGASVTSIAAGKNTGVAPDADIFYFATNSSSDCKDNEEALDQIAQDQNKALKRVLEINAKLTEEEKIRIISISAAIYGSKENAELVKKLNESGCWVLTSDEFLKHFGELAKKDPMGNPDDFSNYKVDHSGDAENPLYVNKGDRTVAACKNSTGYRHDSQSSTSWAIPYVAGLYAVACQADKSMTPQKFLEAAHKTAHIESVPRKNPNARNEILNYGYNKLRKEIMKELYPDLTPEDIENDREKKDKVMERMRSYSKDELEKLCLELAKEYKDDLIKKGIIDENLDYTDKNEKIEIIDAKALMEYLKSNR